jgi:hypothetical protein
MKKKVNKKVRTTKSAGSKKKRSLFANISIGRFRFASAIVLGCLILVAGGVLAYTKINTTSVLGVATGGSGWQCMYVTRDASGNNLCEHGSSDTLGMKYSTDPTKCIPDNPIGNLNTIVSDNNACANATHHTLYIKVVDASNGKKLTLFENVGINITVRQDQLREQTQTITSGSNSPKIIHFDNIYGGYAYYNPVTISAFGTKSVVYQFTIQPNTSLPGFTRAPGKCDGTQQNPCVVKVKIIALPTNAPQPCKTTFKTNVKHNSSICTQVTKSGKSCRIPQVRYTNCRPQTCKERGNYCTTLLSCKHNGGLQVNAPGCSSGQICCD